MDKCYSTNNEDFYHTDISSVLDELDSDGRLEVGTLYYEADSHPLTAPRLMQVDQVLEQADETGYDLIGEAWGNAFDVSAAAKAELQGALNAWAAKHVDVSRYFEIVGKTRPMTVTEADITANADSTTKRSTACT